MKKLYFVGVFTINAEMCIAIREYSSVDNAEKYFKRKCEKDGFEVILSSAKEMDGNFEKFQNELFFRWMFHIKGILSR